MKNEYKHYAQGLVPVADALAGTKNTISDGNLKYSGSTGGDYQRRGTLGASSGKWYFEVKVTSYSGDFYIGISETSNTNYDGVSVGNTTNQYSVYSSSGGTYCSKVSSGFTATNLPKAVNGDIVQIAMDLDNNKFWFGINNTWADSGNPSTGANSLFTVADGTYTPAMTLSGAGVSTTLEANFGQRPFKYTPPTGYKKLNTYNLPDSTIVDGSQYMNTVTYTGTGTTNSITGVGFSPDLLWIKSRSNAFSNTVFDTSRGVGVRLITASTAAETATSTLQESFDSDGFTLKTAESVNKLNSTYVAWNWRGSDSSPVSNTDGTITSTVSANTDSGFSVVTYTGTLSSDTVGHGLGTTPNIIIVKNRDIISNWSVNGNVGGLIYGTNKLLLHTTGAIAVDTNEIIAVTSSTFSVSNGVATNGSGNSHVAYCFAEVEGFSKFGSYTGNGSTDGQFVYTGFRPAFVIQKRTDTAAGWVIQDTARNTYNVSDKVLFPHSSAAENTGTYLIDAVSNGFKLRDSATATNASGGTYIYMAFAESPFKHSLGR